MRKSLLALLFLTLAAISGAEPPKTAQPPAKSTPSNEKPTPIFDTGGHSRPISHILFTLDRKQLITVSDYLADATIRVWDIETGQQVQVMRPPVGGGDQGGSLGVITLSPDGKILAVAASLMEDGKQVYPVFLIDLAVHNIVRVLRGHESPVCALAFAPDGRRLAVRERKHCHMWNLSRAGEKPEWMSKPLGGFGKCLVFSPDGSQLADHAVKQNTSRSRIAQSATGKVLAELKGKEQLRLEHVGGHRLEPGRQDRGDHRPRGRDSLGLEWTPGKSFAVPSFAAKSPLTDPLAFSADLQKVLVRTSSRGALLKMSWIDLATGKEESVFTLPKMKEPYTVTSVAFTPDGTSATAALHSEQLGNEIFVSSPGGAAR